MCGIVGYIGKRDAVPVLLAGLKRLEYRGYDSAGIAYRNGCGVEIYKNKGKIKDLQEIIPTPFYPARAGLGHTRWATHGAPSSTNAHPHHADGITVVHNGIVENYRELKSRLIASGEQFYSQTDTEVIPRLISANIQRGLGLREAIGEALGGVRGTFALGIMSDSEPDTLYAVRKGSPLVVGHGEGEYFFASDVPAILPYTKKVTFLEDGQVCRLGAGGIEITALETKEQRPLDVKSVDIEWSAALAEKDGYDHFMLKEIFEQPQTVGDTIREWVRNPLALLDECGLNLETTMGMRRLHIVACGTSFYAGLVGKYLLGSIARIPVDVEIASEYRYMKPLVEHGTLFVSITQSGETADTLAAQREAKDRGARTLSICNVVGSTATREADAVLYTRAGLEIGVASTKAFTAQLAALYLLAVGLGIRRGRLGTAEAKALKTQLLTMPSLIEKALSKDAEIKELAGRLAGASNFLYLGRGMNYPIALEGALKLKEISYIHAEGYAAGEMKHGPIALIEEGMPVVVVVPIDDLYEKTLSNIEEVKARGGRVIAVTDEPSLLRDRADEIIEVPSTHPSLSPFVNIIPLQLLAYHVGVQRGCDVDQPRNLAKSVTVE